MMSFSQSEENIVLQREELEALMSIYQEDEFTLEGEDPPILRISIPCESQRNGGASILITFPKDYPKTAPPVFELSIPYIRGEEKAGIQAELEQIYLEHVGESIVYLWVEKLREMLQNKTEPSKSLDSSETSGLPGSSLLSSLSNAQSKPLPDANASDDATLGDKNSDRLDLKIVTGDPVTDRKSTFQAHVAKVSSVNDVRAVLKELLRNKKIATATHNMYAYRISKDEDADSFLADCDDDGESHAGSRLLHLLQILDCRNVVVVVTRWYGGIQLHADRFKHINNVARQLLDQEGFIPDGKKRK